jgi:hypothetical protein
VENVSDLWVLHDFEGLDFGDGFLACVAIDHGEDGFGLGFFEEVEVFVSLEEKPFL